MILMYDSAISLSELQLLHNPGTELVILSACETNVGKNAKGEGIFSLARGFAAAGIPSVTATLWQADEQATYIISENFHKYISKGIHKDEAMQKAKLDFINNGDNEEFLPYYWANMILIGSADPVKLPNKPSILWIIAGVLTVIAVDVLTAKLLKQGFRMNS